MASETDGKPDAAPDDEPVPKLPRGRGMKLSGPELFRIAITGGLLVAILLLAKPCGDAVGKFVMGFDKKGSGAMPKPGNVDEPKHYEQLTPGMSQKELEDAVQRAKARAAGSGAPAAGSGSPAGTTGGGGSAGTPAP